MPVEPTLPPLSDDEEEESDESPTAARRIDAKDVTKDKPVKNKVHIDQDKSTGTRLTAFL